MTRLPKTPTVPGSLMCSSLFDLHCRVMKIKRAQKKNRIQPIGERRVKIINS
jgi:hypothetical protein